jgi:guanosine-3',5'-bis(diphosphate) 3'-pyrophosphohydrolase
MKYIFLFIFQLLLVGQLNACQLYFLRDFPINDEFSKAYQLALKAHSLQTRKIGGLPYITHPENVTKILWETIQKVEKRLITDEEKIVAILHDVLEDTKITRSEIETYFGKKVAALLDELTNDKEQIKILGKVTYLTQKMNEMSEIALNIKLADRLDNLSDLSDPMIANKEFVKKMVEQTQEILNGLNRPLTKTHLYFINEINSKLAHNNV